MGSNIWAASSFLIKHGSHSRWSREKSSQPLTTIALKRYVDTMNLDYKNKILRFLLNWIKKNNHVIRTWSWKIERQIVPTSSIILLNSHPSALSLYIPYLDTYLQIVKASLIKRNQKIYINLNNKFKIRDIRRDQIKYNNNTHLISTVNELFNTGTPISAGTKHTTRRRKKGGWNLFWLAMFLCPRPFSFLPLRKTIF